MTITQFYEIIILRDLLEYTLPGAILLSSLGLILESFVRKIGLGVSTFGAVSDGGLVAVFLMLALAFPMGHLLGGLSSLMLRRKDRNQAAKVLKGNPWLGAQTTRAASHYLAIPESQAVELLKDAQVAETLREMARDMIQFKMPTLHREHIGRLSVVSRLCQNMAIALICLLLSLVLSTAILWDEIQVIQTSPLTLLSAGAFVLVVGALLIVAFVNRAARLRRRMMQLTFQIWCVGFYVESNATQKTTTP